jgi:D-alanyl-lipoteichoic acid acyltransferase DltB (MBOAT superfamily)
MIARTMVMSVHKKTLLGVGIGIGLLPLIYFKYSSFLHLSTHSFVLPLAISFYTFQQIAFLVDLYRKQITLGSFDKYLFFVLFFPQLVAGPIVHYREIITQIDTGVLEKVNWRKIETGIVLFSMGLFKKVVLADQFFPLADKAFGQIDTLSSMDAWAGLFAYTFGIYFDFSGYTDMALGLALFFGIKLPVNFNSPYKAVDIADFWRRWHITLSHFLRDYIYIPLGGNRKGEKREVFNLLTTMTLGGIWHGAGWTFLLWGLLHGLFLAAVHVKQKHFPQWKLPKPMAILFTFMAVSLLWVLFRSESLNDALLYYSVLFSLPLESLSAEILPVLLAGFITVWFLPNSMEQVNYMHNLYVKPFYGMYAAVLMFIALKMMAEMPAQRFVYFNF